MVACHDCIYWMRDDEDGDEFTQCFCPKIQWWTLYDFFCADFETKKEEVDHGCRP